jgi:hypothetical protein
MNNEMKLVPCKLCGRDPQFYDPQFYDPSTIKCPAFDCPNMGVVNDPNGAAWNRLNAPDAPAQAETRAARRERIAVAIYESSKISAHGACDLAECLIAELDRRAALDAESAKGGAS